MKNFLFLPVCFAVALCCVRVCPAQTESPQKVGQPQTKKSIVTVIPYEFKAQTLQGQVDEAIEQGKQDYSGPIHQLMETHKAESGQILRLVEKYAQDPNESVRLTVLDAVSLAPFDQTSMRMLVDIVPDASIGHMAVNILYRRLNARQIVEKGGGALRRALFQGAIKSLYMTDGYLLLACYKNNRRTIEFLKRRRSSLSEPDKDDERVSLDLALSKMGDVNATKRINQVIAGGDVREVLDFLRHLKFVTNRGILLRSLELLHKKAQANKISSVDGKLVASSRLCDEALVALFERASLKVGLTSPYEDIAPQFSDSELERAHEQLKLNFSSLPVKS